MKKIEKTKREQLNMFKIKIEVVSESYLKKKLFSVCMDRFYFLFCKKKLKA